MREERSAVVFADLAGFTALNDAHGDVEALEVVDHLMEIAERVAGAEVRVVKTIGDAVMLACGDVVSAITTTFDLVAALHAEPRYPLVSVGIDAGPVLLRDGDVYGRTVNRAARLASVARPGQVLGTAPVAAAARETGCAEVADLGPVALRNLPDPVSLFEIRRCDRGIDELTVVDPVCRMRLDPVEPHLVRSHGGHAWHFCSERCAERFQSDPSRFIETGEPAPSEQVSNGERQ